jgi:pimeloyl-ACP methyl ester carboxylesterase
MSKLQIPVTVMWGEKDIYIKKEMGAEFAERNKLKLTVLPNLGHFPHLQSPQQALSEIRTVLGASG